MFAFRAILAGVHDRNKRWTWAYFAERRDDRIKYVNLFKKRLLNQSSALVEWHISSYMRRC